MPDANALAAQINRLPGSGAVAGDPMLAGFDPPRGQDPQWRAPAKVARLADGRTFAGHLRIMSMTEALALPPREYLIPGFMAPGELSVCWGAPKCGKTFVMMRLTETQRGWLRDITDLFATPDLPEDRVPVPGMVTQRTLTRDQIRDGLRRKGRIGDATGDANLTGAERNALYKMLNTLKDKGRLGLTDQLVWLL